MNSRQVARQIMQKVANRRQGSSQIDGLLKEAYLQGVNDGMEKKAFIGRAWKSITGQTAAENRVAELEQQRQSFLKDRYQDPNRTFDQRGRDYDASQRKTDVSKIQGPHLRPFTGEAYDPDVQEKHWAVTTGGFRREMARRKRLGIETTPRLQRSLSDGGGVASPAGDKNSEQGASTGASPQPNATPSGWTEQDWAHRNYRLQHQQGHRGMVEGEYLQPGDPGRRDAYLTREEQDEYDLQKAHEFFNAFPPYER